MASAFVVINCKQRKTVLTTLSARKAKNALIKGLKVEIWVDNNLFDTAYSNQTEKLNIFVAKEKQFIGRKQKMAEERNKRRRCGK